MSKSSEKCKLLWMIFVPWKNLQCDWYNVGQFLLFSHTKWQTSKIHNFWFPEPNCIKLVSKSLVRHTLFMKIFAHTGLVEKFCRKEVTNLSIFAIFHTRWPTLKIHNFWLHEPNYMKLVSQSSGKCELSWTVFLIFCFMEKLKVSLV